MRRKNPSISRQIPLFPLVPEAALRIELTAPQQHELIRAVAELLLRAAAAGHAAAQEGGPDDDR